MVAHSTFYFSICFDFSEHRQMKEKKRIELGIRMETQHWMTFKATAGRNSESVCILSMKWSSFIWSNPMDQNERPNWNNNVPLCLFLHWIFFISNSFRIFEQRFDVSAFTIDWLIFDIHLALSSYHPSFRSLLVGVAFFVLFF